VVIGEADGQRHTFCDDGRYVTKIGPKW